MATRELSKGYRFNGKVYGPGRVELEDDVAKAIDKFREEVEEGGDAQTAEGSLRERLDEQTAELLIAAGYGSLSSVRDASDEELLSINGLGQGKLGTIRDAL